ncbi:MAG: LysR family transcriptional regulator [Pseudomonadota bacterium]
MTRNWDDLRAVLCVARGKTLAAAAAELGVNYTTVARRIARLERAMGARLFERLADGYVATETGAAVARHAETMEEAELALLRQISGRDESLAGPLTITAPQLLISNALAPVIDDFCAAHPDVELDIRATNELLDLSRRDADLAVRISRDPGDALIGVRLTAQHTASFDSPAWAARIENDPAGRIDWLLHRSGQRLPDIAAKAYPGSRVHILFDDMAAMIGAAKAGLGVIRAPMFIGRTSPGLVQIPLLPPQPYADIWVVGHRDVWPAAKPAAFRAVLIRGFKRCAPLFTA